MTNALVIMSPDIVRIGIGIPGSGVEILHRGILAVIGLVAGCGQQGPADGVQTLQITVNPQAVIEYIGITRFQEHLPVVVLFHLGIEETARRKQG